MSGVGVNTLLKKRMGNNTELKHYLYLMAKVEDGELTFKKAEKFGDVKFSETEEEAAYFEKTEVGPDSEDPKDAFERVKQLILEEPACFIVYNLRHGPQNKSSKCFFIRWIDDNSAGVRTKMLYASSSNSVTSRLPNLQNNVVQCCDAGDIQYEKFMDLVKKL